MRVFCRALAEIQGILIHARRALVIGYGKVGRGTASALVGRNCAVATFDIDPVRNALALAEGFRIPERDVALRAADLVFGCTGVTAISGADFPKLKSGCVLVSCSSKKIEFDVAALDEAKYRRTNLARNYDRYELDRHILYLLGEGGPINFVDGAVIGPALSLVQAEILYGIKELAGAERTDDIAEIGAPRRQEIAKRWWDVFCDPETGCYRQ
jgi:adenosylhomocysteinase